jgi:CRISPR-associated protein Cas6
MNVRACHPGGRVDLVFPAVLVEGDLPADSRHATYGALGRVTGADLHDSDWMAIFPLIATRRAGRPGELRLRVIAEAASSLRCLGGGILEIYTARVRLGEPAILPILPARSLASEFVTIHWRARPDSSPLDLEDHVDEGAFAAAVMAQLRALQVRARIEVGPARGFSIDHDIVVGRALVLHDLDPAGSIRVQEAGLGGRARFGCGLFLPRHDLARPARHPHFQPARTP